MLSFLLFAASAAAQSVSNCAGAGAHFQNMVVTASPDPPVNGEDLTIQFEGTFDKEVQHGVFVFSVKAGPIDLKAVNMPFSFSPGIGKAGEKFTATVGPFKYPNLKVPLFNHFSGKIEISQDDGEEWLCIAYNLPTMYNPEAEAKKELEDTFVDCADKSQAVHFQNFEITTDPAVPKKGDDMNVTIKGDLDEDLDKINLDFALDLSLLKFELNIPVTFSPAVKATTGIVANVGPVNLQKIPLIPNAKGSCVLSDGNGEQISCVNYNIPVMGEAESLEV